MSNYIDSIQLSGTVYTIQGTGGGGKAIEAGRGISITTGETADTVSFNLPISAGTGAYSIAEGSGTEASGDYSHAEGDRAKAQGNSSHAEGRSTIASGNRSHAEGQSTRATGVYSHAEGCITQANGAQSHAEGYETIANNKSEHASGQYNVSSSASTTFGDSGNTLFSVGNGTNNARHNAFEIRQNGDIYLTKDGQDVKLQDQLGGSSITVDTALDSGSTNPVENRVIYNKIDEVEQVTAAALNNINDSLSGKADTSAVTESINAAVSGKVDTSTFTAYTASTDTAIQGKQDTLVSGISIKTVNNQSLLGSGNIDIQGGGMSPVEVQTMIDESISGKADTSSLATVATSGSYNDLDNKPTIPTSTSQLTNDAGYVTSSALGNYVTTNTEQTISGRKIFTYTDSSGKAIEFKQTSDAAKVGFSIKNSASTNNEVASFEFRPNTFTIDNVQHPLMYFGHYRNKNVANAGVPQTVIGFRQYDQKNAAAYHYLLPLPEKAKTPFSLTTSFKDYYAPMGFKNGSTMITADNTGVVDLSSVLGGLKLVKLSEAEYNALATKDSSTLYVIVD